MSDIVDSLSDYIRAGFDPHNQLKEARGEIERLNAEIARLREALIRIETLADEMMLGRSSYVGAIRDTARAALAEQEK